MPRQGDSPHQIRQRPITAQQVRHAQRVVDAQQAMQAGFAQVGVDHSNTFFPDSVSAMANASATVDLPYAGLALVTRIDRSGRPACCQRRLAINLSQHLAVAVVELIA